MRYFLSVAVFAIALTFAGGVSADDARISADTNSFSGTLFEVNTGIQGFSTVAGITGGQTGGFGFGGGEAGAFADIEGDFGGSDVEITSESGAINEGGVETGGFGEVGALGAAGSNFFSGQSGLGENTGTGSTFGKWKD